MTDNEKKLVEMMANVFDDRGKECKVTAVNSGTNPDYSKCFWTCGIVLQDIALELRKQIFEESSCNPPQKDQ